MLYLTTALDFIVYNDSEWFCCSNPCCSRMESSSMMWDVNTRNPQFARLNITEIVVVIIGTL